MNVRPYAEAAWQYRRAGWTGVIPVGYGPRKKNPPIKGYTGWAGADPSGADVQAWIDGREGGWNLGLHLPSGIVVPDVDAYNGGDRALARLTAEVGHALPPTWTSTARGQADLSRHRFYRAVLPEGRVWRDHPGGDKSGIDALHVGHRYAVVWPSIHPSGEMYWWYDLGGEPYEDAPSPGEFTKLDADWIEILSKPGTPLEGNAADDATTMAVVERMRHGKACRRVGALLRVELSRIEGARDRESAGGLHAPGKLYALAALGIEGHAGVRVALSQHQAAYVQARMQYRGESEQFADADWMRMLRGAVGKWIVANGEQRDTCDCDAPSSVPAAPVSTTTPENRPQTAPELPGQASTVRDAEGLQWPEDWAVAPAGAGEVVPYDDDPPPDDPTAGADTGVPDEAFWTARKVLWHIHQSAIAGYSSPWGVLGSVLVRVLAATPPTVQLPNTIGGYGSLNLFVALVAGPSGGKGSSDAVARTCIEIDPRRSGPMTAFAENALGSGEGLAHMFMKRPKASRRGEPDPEPFQYNTAALVTIPEIDTLAALQNRQGSTLGGQLRQAAMGEQLGFFYVDRDKRMLVPEHSYRLCLLAGVQPKRAAGLFAEADGGTPQRFAWLPATVEAGALPAEEDMPEPPEPLLWVAPVWPVAQLLRGKVRTIVQLPEVAIRRTIELRRLSVQGQGDPLDGHANYVRLKVAAALAILDGRCEVDEEDWDLSAVIMARSNATRQHILDELATERRERNAAEAEAEAHKRIIVEDRVEAKDRQQVASTVRNKLARAEGPDGWVPHAEVRSAVKSKLRGEFDPVITAMLATGAIQRQEVEHRGKPGVVYRLSR